MISREDIEKLNKEDCVRLAVKAANLVSHLSDDPRVMGAIEAAENWLADPSEKNRQAAHVAARTAARAAARAAWVAVDAASATYAAEAAADAATYAANAAWIAAYAAIKADPSVEVVLVKYLEELLS